MKSLAALSTLLAVTAAAVPQPTPTKASYDGHKVFRVMVGSKPQRVSDVVDRLGLSFWQHPTRKGAFADIEVPPARVDEFRKEMEGLELITMHEDLGKSIADEGAFHIYAGESVSAAWQTAERGIVSVLTRFARPPQRARPTRRGSTRTTPTMTTCSSSTTWRPRTPATPRS